ncbi:RNA polymerase sigma factor [Peteryoungia desertarenae]|uniref:RNA polymerase sigma factor n=1 Tax=Peteryoungia desertarenae TaxID=1813451 RepID=A0ABX6QNN0_9HYPH|nr:RNA polymerase sigma factor [Peteryoungia desertarenae]QLF69901.1 RNA polymerase sigma factor [Peteryoungia desertarenae]
MVEMLDQLYRQHSRKVLASLIRLLGSFDLAEEAMQDAFLEAARQWTKQGVPRNPVSWLVSTGRFRVIDRLRRDKRFGELTGDVTESLYGDGEERMESEPDLLSDDELRLIFICCHPALPPDAQIALALREVCGLKTEEIARAFLVSAPTIAQRIVRAKKRIRDLELAYEVPPSSTLAMRLSTVLHVIYLVFNEGYAASAGPDLMRLDLAEEAIRLNRLLIELLPEAEVLGLAALLLFQHARAPARRTSGGDLILLADQDRSLWKQDLIAEACVLLDRAMAGGEAGAYTLQAAIAGLHSTAATSETTDWRRIVRLYDLLLQATPSPVVALNRAVAVAMVEGPAAGLTLVNQLMEAHGLSTHHLAHAARADFLRQLGDADGARSAYQQALALARLDAEREFLARRIRELD